MQHVGRAGRTPAAGRSIGAAAMRTSREHRAALLGEPGLLEPGGVAAVEVGGHLQDLPRR